MAFIRRSNGGLMEVDNPNEYKGKAVWDTSEEPFSVDKNINSLKLTNSKYYQTGSKFAKSLLKPSSSAKENEDSSNKESSGKNSSRKGTNSWKLGFKNFKKLFKFNKSKSSKLEAELEAKMKLTDETKNPPKKSLFTQLLTNLYTTLTNIIQSINFNTILTLIATFILLSLVFHLYHDFDKLYNEHLEKNFAEKEEATDYYNTHCKQRDLEDPDMDEDFRDRCYQAKKSLSLNYPIVNKTRVWVELIGGLINHFFNSLSLKTLIILVGLIVLGSVLTNLSSILNIGKGRAKDDEPREVRHVLYFENYQNNQGQNSSQLRSISQDSSNFGGRTIEAGSVSSSNLVPLSSY